MLVWPLVTVHDLPAVDSRKSLTALIADFGELIVLTSLRPSVHSLSLLCELLFETTHLAKNIQQYHCSTFTGSRLWDQSDEILLLTVASCFWLSVKKSVCLCWNYTSDSTINVKTAAGQVPSLLSAAGIGLVAFGCWLHQLLVLFAPTPLSLHFPLISILPLKSAFSPSKSALLSSLFLTADQRREEW